MENTGWAISMFLRFLRTHLTARVMTGEFLFSRDATKAYVMPFGNAGRFCTYPGIRLLSALPINALYTLSAVPAGSPWT